MNNRFAKNTVLPTSSDVPEEEARMAIFRNGQFLLRRRGQGQKETRFKMQYSHLPSGIKCSPKIQSLWALRQVRLNNGCSGCNMGGRNDIICDIGECGERKI